MKHVKLFEEFLSEESSIEDLLGGPTEDEKKDNKEGGEEKKEEDPIKKMQQEEKAKEKKAEERFKATMSEKVKEVEDKFDEYPDIKKEIGSSVIDAIKSEDRVRIHNAVNDLTYLQVKYEKAGQTDKVAQVSGIKTLVDELDKSYTTNKNI